MRWNEPSERGASAAVVFTACSCAKRESAAGCPSSLSSRGDELQSVAPPTRVLRAQNGPILLVKAAAEFCAQITRILFRLKDSGELRIKLMAQFHSASSRAVTDLPAQPRFENCLYDSTILTCCLASGLAVPQPANCQIRRRDTLRMHRLCRPTFSKRSLSAQ